MIARVSTFEDIDLDLLDEMRAWNRAEVLPRVRALEGVQAGLTLLNRDERKIRSIAVFDTEEHARAAESTLAELLSLMPEDLRRRVEASGRRGPFIELCEVLAMDSFGEAGASSSGE